jgi:hypothetical protein
VTATVQTAAISAACQPPPEQLSVDQAHQVMQEHLRCQSATCPQRQAALAVLVEAGHYRLAMT